jgi:hypothetical protein
LSETRPGVRDNFSVKPRSIKELVKYQPKSTKSESKMVQTADQKGAKDQKIIDFIKDKE